MEYKTYVMARTSAILGLRFCLISHNFVECTTKSSSFLIIHTRGVLFVPKNLSSKTKLIVLLYYTTHALTNDTVSHGHVSYF